MRTKLFTILSFFIFAVSVKAQNYISSSNTLICAGESVTLTANHDFLHNWFLWSNGATTNSIVVSPNVTTSYSLNLYDVDANSIAVSFTQSVSLCSGIIKETLNNTLQIFPNPSKDIVVLKGIEKEATLKIYNSIGALVYQNTLTVDRMEIDLTNYTTGIYFIKINSADTEIIRKIIKQ
jgi:hypothetical protein